MQLARPALAQAAERLCRAATRAREQRDLAAIRERLFQARFAAWRSTPANGPFPKDGPAAAEAKHQQAPAMAAQLRREIAKMPKSELRRVAAQWARQERGAADAQRQAQAAATVTKSRGLTM
jgi:hypothetical protein